MDFSYTIASQLRILVLTYKHKSVNPTLAQVLSLAEFLQLAEVKPACEFVDARMTPKPVPQGKYSILQTRLVAVINQQGIPEKRLYAFTELRCTFGGRSLIPDIAIFDWERIPISAVSEVEHLFTICPDWVMKFDPRNKRRYG